MAESREFWLDPRMIGPQQNRYQYYSETRIGRGKRPGPSISHPITPSSRVSIQRGAQDGPRLIFRLLHLEMSVWSTLCMHAKLTGAKIDTSGINYILSSSRSFPLGECLLHLRRPRATREKKNRMLIDKHAVLLHSYRFI